MHDVRGLWGDVRSVFSSGKSHSAPRCALGFARLKYRPNVTPEASHIVYAVCCIPNKAVCCIPSKFQSAPRCALEFARDTAYSFVGDTAYTKCEASGVTFGLYFSLGNHIAHPGALWNLLGIQHTALLGIQHTAYTMCEASGVTFGLYFNLGNHIAHPGCALGFARDTAYNLLGRQHTRSARPLG